MAFFAIKSKIKATLTTKKSREAYKLRPNKGVKKQTKVTWGMGECTDKYI